MHPEDAVFADDLLVKYSVRQELRRFNKLRPAYSVSRKDGKSVLVMEGYCAKIRSAV